MNAPDTISRVGGFYPVSRETLRNAVEYIMGSGVHGDVVEFGCYRGMTATILAQAMQEHAPTYDYSEKCHGIAPRKLWIFDSFEGFPVATEAIDKESPHIKAGVWYAGQPSGGVPEVVRDRCATFLGQERVTVIAGWFKDTLAQIPADTKFALIHIDCDYYESTSQVLECLFGNDMISDGGTILFDDWYCNRGSPRFGEQRAWNEMTSKYNIEWSDYGPYGIVGRRFIVHKGGE